MIEDLVQQLIDRLDHQYMGKHRGYVHANEDPEGRGRIRAIVPGLLGETTPTGWAEAALPFAGPDQGFFTVPDLGTGCWIEFEGGDLSQPIWTGCWWGAPTPEEQASEDSATRRSTPATQASSAAGTRTPETPQTNLPLESPTAKVRVFKSSTGHHIVLDDREGSERIEIHDSRGNRLILSDEGFDKIVLNDRTYNKGNRSQDIDGSDEIDIARNREVSVGGTLTESVRGDAQLSVSGNYSAQIAGNTFDYDHRGTKEDFAGPRTTAIRGSDTLDVTGAGSQTYVGGLNVNSGQAVSFASAGPFKVRAAVADTGLSGISMSTGLGNVSINSLLGVMQLGGTSAISPMVLGDGLMIHFTMLSQLMKAVNPPLAPFYGPAFDAWAAMTPALDLSYFGFVKRLPVG